MSGSRRQHQIANPRRHGGKHVDEIDPKQGNPARQPEIPQALRSLN